MSSVEDILAKILEPDNEAIKAGTIELREAMKRPTIAPTLLHIGKYSTNPQIRQYSLVLLRKRLSKYYQYEKLSLDFKHGIKSGILDALARETESGVRNAIAQIIGCIAKHELGEGKWPELLNCLQQLWCQGNASEKELAMFTLSVVADIAGEEFKPYLKPFISVFHSAFQDVNSGAAYYAAITLKNLIQYIGSEEAAMVQPLIPKIAIVVKKLVQSDESKAVVVMEIWEELLETEISLLVPHLKVVSELSIEIAGDKQLDDATRVKALHFLSSLARLKKKSMIKNKLVTPVLQMLFKVMSEEDEEDPDDEEDDHVESSKPSIVAAQTLNEMALHLPPDRVVTPLLHWAEPAVKGCDTRSQSAAYLALAVIAEGCAEHIRTKYLSAFVQCICTGIKNPVHSVRNSALYAVGQFSEHLQPDINKFANDILPILLAYLSDTCTQLKNNQKVPKSIDRVFYALEMFCETMEEKLTPFLPVLMEHFFAALDPSSPVHVKELALSAIGATANAVSSTMAVFFPQIMEHLKVFLSGQLSPDEMPLQIQALDTLGVVARTIGEETFLPFAEECLHFTLNLSRNQDDPDLRKCVYGVFASLSTVLKDNMGPALPHVVDLLITAVESNEGVSQYKDNDEESFPGADGLDEEDDLSPMDNDNEDDDENDATAYTVENAYLEEKEEACLALKDIALHSSGAFVPFIGKCSGPVLKLVDYGHEDVRQAALCALGQFTICVGKHPSGLETCIEALTVLIPKLSEVINTDPDMEVVNSAFATLADLLKELKGLVLKTEGHTEAIIMCVRNAFSKSTQCQMMDQAEEGHPEDDELEGDSEASEKLIEYAGDVLPVFGCAMNPREFAPYFAGLLPSILQKTKKHCTIAERSFSIGLLAVCVEPLDGVLEPFVPHLYPAFTSLMRDEDSEVRNNAIFGLGELVLHGRELLFSSYPQILQNLSAVLSREDNDLVKDNISAALARLIMTNMDSVPMDQVFPALLKNLPLKEDFHEYTSILRCFTFMFQRGHLLFQSNLWGILNVVLEMSRQHKKLETEQKTMMMEFIGNIGSAFPQVYQEWISSLTPDIKEEWSKISF